MTRPVVRGSAGRKPPPPNGESGPAVAQRDGGSERQLGEVDDEVGPLGRRQQDVAHLQGRRQVTRPRCRSSTSARLLVVEPEDQEPGVAAVQHPEPVAARLDLQERPGPSVHDHAVAEELRVPDGGDLALGHVRSRSSRRRRPACPGRTASRRSLNERSWIASGISWCLVPGGSPSWGAGPGSTAGAPVPATVGLSAGSSLRSIQKPAGPAYTLSLVMPRVWSWYQSVEGTWVFGYRLTRPDPVPHVSPAAAAFAAKKSNHVPTVAYPLGMSVGVGQEPGLRVAVAPVRHVLHAVHVDADRHRPAVGAGGGGERRSAVASRDAAGRVGPVQRGIDRQQMRQEVAADRRSGR